ncbi:hypothetical protein [Nocardioides sp. LS1]|uniref:hypothetical protein n=1 Tax=Nocardioides sp. LS1 TaxID=1027620 RepID=UPI000FFAE399|nr:hypothetical protein [Nocardioides sp. LS1]GCD91738.1 hypothetical protein NLS1_37440 [Nocardioides sp. LS1]
MLRQHPARVLAVVAAVAIGLFALSAPGADDTSGAWYYISAFGWFGFLLTALLFVVLAIVVAVQSAGRRRALH